MEKNLQQMPLKKKFCEVCCLTPSNYKHNFPTTTFEQVSQVGGEPRAAAFIPLLHTSISLQPDWSCSCDLSCISALYCSLF